MKRMKLLLLSLCVSAALACTGIFAACGEDDASTAGGDQTDQTQTDDTQKPDDNTTDDKKPDDQTTKYSVTYSAGVGTGTATVAGNYAEGATFTVADADDYAFTYEVDGTAYHITKWNDGTTDYAFGATYTMPAHNVTLTAQWEADSPAPPTTYSVTYSAGVGTGTATDAGSYAEGATFTVADADDYAFTYEVDGTTYHIAKWNDGAADYAFGATYTMPAHAVTLTAQWEADVPAKEIFTDKFVGIWTEYGKDTGAQVLEITKTGITVDGEDVTDSVTYDEAEHEYSVMVDLTTTYKLGFTEDGLILYARKTNGTYVLFAKAGLPDITIAASKLLGKTFTNFKNTNFTEGKVGDLAVTAEGKLTLGGKDARVLSIVENVQGESLSSMTFVSGGMWYHAFFETYIRANDLVGTVTYQFDGIPMTDFTGYVGTWKKFAASYSALDTQLEITQTTFTYAVKKNCYEGFDGSCYYKDGSFRTVFGKLTDGVLYIRMSGSNIIFFNATGEISRVNNIPAAFHGAWRSPTYFGLNIAASTIAVDGKDYTPFAVSGAAGKEVIHALSDTGLYVTFYMDADASGKPIVKMDNGTIAYTFTAVVPEPLPAEFAGTWNQMGGTDTVVVDDAGKFTYNSTVYETVRGIRDGEGWHFTLGEATASLMVSSDGYALILIDGQGNTKYFQKEGVSSYPDCALNTLGSIAQPLLGTTWKAGEVTMTIDSSGKITVNGTNLQILSQETTSDPSGIVATFFWDNKWGDLIWAEGTITLGYPDYTETIFTPAE